VWKIQQPKVINSKDVLAEKDKKESREANAKATDQKEDR
jgi:hypothetical protein